MKNCKEKVEAILSETSQFPMDDKERFLVKHYLSDFEPNIFQKSVKTDEELEWKFLGNLYGLMSCASLHDRSHKDWNDANRVFCYIAIVFHDNWKVRTMLSKFFETQDNLVKWYKTIRPFLRDWKLPEWANCKELF